MDQERLALYYKNFPPYFFIGGRSVSDTREVLNLHQIGLKAFYNELKLLHPRDFDMNILNVVFNSFLSSSPRVPLLTDIETGQNKKKWFPCFIHDNNTYRATIETRTTYMENHETKWLTLRLPNNGFLYPPDTELPVAEKHVHHRKSCNWVTLDNSIEEKLKDVFSFAYKYLQEPSGATWTLFYSFNEDRVDFEMKDAHLNGVQICFKHEYPTTDFEPNQFVYNAKKS